MFLKQNRSGFTMVELLVVLAISSIVFTLMYQIYAAQLKSHTTQQELVEMQQNMRAALYLMEREIRMAGYVSTPDKAREDNPLDYMVHVRKVALPLLPQLGLEPNVYYVPPLHVPLPYLRQMFGPGVDHALKTYRSAPEDRTLAALLSLDAQGRNGPRL